VKVPLLEIKITPTVVSDLLDWLETEVCSNKSNLLVGHNLHSTYLYHTNQAFQSTYDRANIVLCDGFPIAFLSSRVLKISTSDLRIGSTDWIPHLGQLSSLSRIAVIGARPEPNAAFCGYLVGIVGEAVEVQGWPGAQWSDAKALQVLDEVSIFKPQLTIVGLGMPIQENFSDVAQRVLPGVVALVGGAIDQLSGHQKNAPRVLGKIGLEWVWRLISQPRRLFSRYLIEPWLLALVLFRKKLKS
jgi:N-acetylglucosaminyldiphosphoundecaprenol N-acetyl-beta-D-mannosaminyltransferase